ncbi:hypothetical protein HWV62_10048 [Athelia sp. TMB]|nr:hypothetical protein HWV62_10048 [Athelia sp. TMB]
MSQDTWTWEFLVDLLPELFSHRAPIMDPSDTTTAQFNLPQQGRTAASSSTHSSGNMDSADTAASPPGVPYQGSDAASVSTPSNVIASPPPLYCLIRGCGSLLEEKDITKHVREQHYAKRFADGAIGVHCDVPNCGLGPFTLKGIGQHVKGHFPKDQLTLGVDCPVCDKHLSRSDSLRRHLSTQHGATDE